MSSPTTNVSVSGTTLTVTVTDCNETPTVSLSPNPNITPSTTAIGRVKTFTFSGMPNGTYTVTIRCGKETFTSSVTIPGN
jgi:hypothetical protein